MRDELVQICNKILAILDEIRETQKTILENQQQIYEQVGGETED